MAGKKRVNRRGISIRSILVILILVALIFLTVTFVYDPLTGRVVRSSSTDKIAPNITIQSPINGSSIHVGDSMTIRVAASDNRGVREINLYINGTLVKRCRYSTSCQYSFTVRTEGVYLIGASAKDSARNTATATVIAFGTPKTNLETCSEPLTETRTIECGSGYTGLITETRTKGPAPQCAWSNWTKTSDTCVEIVPVPVESCPSHGTNAFTTCFYQGTNFDSFITSRTDPKINFDWGTGSPQTGVPLDIFSAKFSGSFTFEEGEYQFTIVGDDGTKLYIDGVKIDDQWNDHGATTYLVNKTFTSGDHLVTLEYYENGGQAVVYLDWKKNQLSIDQAPTTNTTNPNECNNPGQGWIWCDDFEQDRISSYFEYDNDEGDFSRVASTGLGSSTGMRTIWQTGEVGAGSLKLAFGKAPSSYFKQVDSGTTNYKDIYWRVYVKNQPNWVGGAADKITRATILSSSSWAQAAIGHVWGMNTNYLGIDPASGTDTSGALKTTVYNDFPNLRWLGAVSGTTPIFSGNNLGQWHCVETHMKLNDAGQSNGVQELWINGNLEAQKTNLNWVGSYDDYGINAIFLENYWNAGSPTIQERYFDNFVVSTQRIGCGVSQVSSTQSSTTTTILPPTLSISASPSSITSEQSSTISWSSANANSCTASGGWTGTKAISGTQSVSPTSSTTYTLACTGSSGTTTQSTTVSVTTSSTTSGDTTAPGLYSSRKPGSAEILALGTRTTTLEINTNENSVCRYSTNYVTSYDSMPNSFAITGGKTHSSQISGLEDGKAYTYYVRCKDTTGNVQTRNNVLGFSVASSSTPPSGPNEPSGMTLLYDNEPNGWGYGVSNNFQVVSDSSATKSPSTVSQALFPVGMGDGVGPMRGDFSLKNSKTTYLSFWVKLSSNWQGHSSNVNKIFHVYTCGGNKIVILGRGSDNNPIKLDIGLQGIGAPYSNGFGSSGTTVNLYPNQGLSSIMNRDEWHHVEVILTANTAGVADGSVQVFLNGQKTVDYSGIMYCATGTNSKMEIASWAPTWGGRGDSVEQDMWMWMDHFRVSVK